MVGEVVGTLGGFIVGFIIGFLLRRHRHIDMVFWFKSDDDKRGHGDPKD